MSALPSFAGMHRAPSNARLQTHVHATSRMPQLQQPDCMAHPKNSTGNRRKMFLFCCFFFILNSSSFGQKQAGHLNETICVIMRPLTETRTHVMRRVERKVLSRVRSGFRGGGERARREGEAEWGEKSLQSQTLHRCTPLLLDSFLHKITDYSSHVTALQIKRHYFMAPIKLLPLAFHPRHE